MGTINPNGIFIYDDTESLSPLSSYMNLQGSALSTRLAQDVRFKKVANEAARTAYVNEVGIANISAANPLAVYRQNAAAGLRFEVTYNGTTWDPLPSKSYFDAQDTGWVDIIPEAGFTPSAAWVRRIGAQVFFRGRITGPLSTTGTTIGTVPAAFVPGGGFDNGITAVGLGSGVVARGSVTSSGAIIIVPFTNATTAVFLKGLSGYTVN